jgi:hypothetical protein
MPKTIPATSEGDELVAQNALRTAALTNSLGTETTLSEQDWSDLLEKIEGGSCTPFLGAGASRTILPTGENLAEQWADKFGFPFPHRRSELPAVAQFVGISKENDIWPKEEVVRSFKRIVSGIDLQEAFRQPNALSTLADLPFPVYMTTNYDDLLFQALQAKGKNPKFDICCWNQITKDLPIHSPLKDRKVLFEPSAQCPVIFHLHGHQRFPQSIVLTEDDYYNFIVAMSQRPKTNLNTMLPPRILQAIKHGSLLFIGYRLTDLSFLVLFRTLFEESKSGQQFENLAVQLPHKDGAAAQEYLRKYYGRYHIKIFWGDATAFVRELRDRWEVFKHVEPGAA